MSKWSLQNSLLQVRFSALVSCALLLIAFIQLFSFYGTYNYSHIPREELLQALYKKTAGLPFEAGKPDCFYGHILNSKKTADSWAVRRQYDDFSAAGVVNGSFLPPSCRPLFSVAVLVTYRDRPGQLNVFLPYMHNFLRKQNIHYKIFVVEQQNKKPFNRGLLYNVGARHAMLEGFPCLVLHDVDLLPLNEGNLYACTQQPRHMSGSIDKFRFVLPYARLVGGVLALRADHYALLNGFSNRFHGWGGEDDDLSFRITANGLQIQRFPRELSEYTMLVHRPEARNGERARIMADNRRRARPDGLDTTPYESMRVTQKPLMTLIGVNL